MGTDTPRPLGQLLRSRRKELGLTLEALAEQVELTPGALSHIESGRRLPDPRNAVRIAGALGVDEELVLGALDAAHAERRRSSAYEQQSVSRSRPPRMAASAPADHSAQGAFYAMPIEALFEPAPSSSSARHDSARNLARWSEDTSARIEAIDRLADTAADAIRTLKGLLGDDDPMVRREAMRLLRELDVRLPEE